MIDSTYSPARKTVTDYIAGAVFQNDTLQFVIHELGRLRPVVKSGQPRIFVYDYFVKDHLGNVRMVLTEQSDFATYTATMEMERAPLENALFSNIENTRTVKPAGYPVDNSAGENKQVSRLNGTNRDKKIGPSLVLRVMAGDTIAIGAKAFFKSIGQPSDEKLLPIGDMAAALVNAFGNSVGTNGKKVGSVGENRTPFSQRFMNENYERLKGKDRQAGRLDNRPKAYLNFVLFDEQFNLVEENSGVKQVKAEPDQSQVLAQEKMAIEKSGFLYVYTSNETQQDVYFDNLMVEYTTGPILEETHYYPYGLTMAGISAKAMGIRPNKEQTFQEQRFDDDLGVNYLQFKYRSHDPQIGRFIQIDPLADNYRHNSTYAFSENRVVNGRELEGLEYVSIHHYANGVNGIKTHYKSSDEEINERGGTTAGFYNSASYGPLGKGVIHYYYNKDGEVTGTRWEQQQTGGSSDFEFHGLYSGPGSVTSDGVKGSKNYDFGYQPIDMADAIAKRHDMDYAEATKTGEDYAGFVEDIRTLQADKDMIQRCLDAMNPFKTVKGIETPYRTTRSGEMDAAISGQADIIKALAVYKQWKIDNGYGNKDTYDKLRSRFVNGSWSNWYYSLYLDKMVSQ